MFSAAEACKIKVGRPPQRRHSEYTQSVWRWKGNEVHDHSVASCEVWNVDVLRVERKPERRLRATSSDGVVSPWSYLAKMGLGTIRLSPVEFRILQFLAARPYRAYTRRRIAQAVSTESEPVTEQSLGRYIRSLRSQLGFYSDYIQRVPYVGYRFKA